MPVETKTIADLERLLEGKRQRLEALQQRRDRLVGQVAKVDEQIRSLAGKATARREVRRRRRTGQKSLQSCVVDVLSQSAEPKTAAEIAEAVIAAGYRSSSKNPVALVRHVCYTTDRIETKERGKFVLASEPRARETGRKTKKSARK